MITPEEARAKREAAVDFLFDAAFERTVNAIEERVTSRDPHHGKYNINFEGGSYDSLGSYRATLRFCDFQERPKYARKLTEVMTRAGWKVKWGKGYRSMVIIDPTDPEKEGDAPKTREGF